MMGTNQKHTFTWVPLALAAALVLGVLIGSKFTARKSVDSNLKLNNVIGLIENEYVDDINVDTLVEMALPDILSKLDPHSIYFSAQEIEAANAELEGSFSGIGVSFQIMEDTVNVVEVIPGGPAEKVGVLTGDKIVTVDGKSFVGEKIDNNTVMKSLRGNKGTKVKLGIKRASSNEICNFTVTRGDIPVKSVDASYIIEKNTGYVKVNTFGRNTYQEFSTALEDLRSEGATRYIVDLRGNGGGYMEMAIQMVNEFLPANQLIVSTKGRYKREDSQVYSDGNGRFQDVELVVLIDEFSASASEIFAGAIQDNDRGLVVGNRSFGKGLVQQQFSLFDNSAIRLTIARYYTPSGRCIQKDYKNGVDYNQELLDRYKNGELYNQDSIKIDKSKIFKTAHGRTVYGGGGIIPDIFVAKDTSDISSYYIQAVNAGMFQQFVLKYVQNNKSSLSGIKDYKQLLRVLNDNTNLLNDFVNYASSHGIPARWYYIDQSRELILTNLKALIARDLLGQSAFYPIYNRHDKTIEAALKALNKHKATYPIQE